MDISKSFLKNFFTSIVFIATFSFSDTFHIATTGSDETGDGSQLNPFATIQHGIDTSSDGDTVLVEAGTYVENINYNGKNIALIGEDSETTIIDGGQNASVVTFSIYEEQEDSTASLINFTIQNGLSDTGAGLYIENTNLLCENLIIRNNTGYDGSAIYTAFSESVFSGILITNNDGGAALRLDGYQGDELDPDDYAKIINIMSTTIAGNSHGIDIDNEVTLNCLNTIYWQQSLVGSGVDNISINYSIIQDGWEGEGNINTNPLFCNPDSGNYTLASNSPALGSGQAGANMGAFGVGCGIIDLKIYVSNTGSDETGDGSVENPFATIQHGIDASSNSDTVLVSAGTYVETINYNGKNIVVGSLYLTTQDTSYISSTIIDGNQSGGVVTFESGEDSLSVLSGFTIQNGYKNSNPRDGAGIFIYNAAATLDHLIIKDNVAERYGGGIAIQGIGTTIISNTYIINNNAANYGGGVIVRNSDVDFQNCIIINNISGGSGSALHITKYGGGNQDGGTVNLSDCLISNNISSGNEPSIYATDFNLSITNCTIANNSGAIWIDQQDLESQLNIINTIIWNSGELIMTGDLASNITYSNIQGGWNGEGNINANPYFCYGEYTLAENSPCVGTGQDGANMGAFGVGCEAHIPILHVATTGSDDNDGMENSPFATIQAGIDAAIDGDTILVHPGTYYRADSIDHKSLTIMSTGGQDSTFLTLSEDQDYGMFRIEGGPENEIQVSLKGFTISKFTLEVYKANVSLENNLFTDSSMVWAMGHEAGDEIEWQLQITDCQFKNIQYEDYALQLNENMSAFLTNVVFDTVRYCIQVVGAEIQANNIYFEQIQGTAIKTEGMTQEVSISIQNMFYQENNSDTELSIFDFGYQTGVGIESLTFYSDRNAAAFEIYENSYVELNYSEVRMVEGRWFDIRENSAINLNSTLLSGESTLAMIDSESYLNAYNSTIVSVDPYYLYADYPLIEYDHTLSFINLSGCYLSNTIVWSDNGYSIDFSNFESNVHYSIFTADDEDVGNLQGLFNLDIDPFFCEDNTYNLAANSPAVGAGEDGVDIGAFGIGCDSLFFSPEIFLFYQNGDTLAANVQMVEDDTLYLNYLLLDQNLDESLELIWTNTTNVQISDDDLSDNIIEIIPAPDWNGVDTLNIIVSDGSLLDTATIYLEVVNVNDPPGMFSLLYPADGDTADILTTDSIMSFSWTKSHDIDQDTILYDFNLNLEFFNQTFGISQEMISDTIVVIDMEQLLPLFEFFDSDGITEMNWNVKAYDNESSYQSPDNILNIIINVNDAPVISTIADTSMDEDSILSLELSGTDVDGDYLSFSVDPIDNIDAYIFADGDSLMLVPEQNWYGTADVTIRVSDGNGLEDSTSFTVTVNSVDDEPFVEGYLEDIYMYEDSQEPWEVNLDEIFTDIDGELTFTAELLDTTVIGVNLDGSMLSLYTLPDANGETEMIVTASNPMRASVSDTVVVTVFAENDAPVLFAPDSIVMDEDQTFELMSMAELMEASILTDIDNSIDDLSFELYTDNDQIQIVWDGDPSSNPVLVPDENYNGTSTLTLCVNDGEYEVCGENSVTIAPVNDAPFFAAEMHASIGLNLDFHVPIHVDDIDFDSLTVSFSDGAVVPRWVSIDNNSLHGMPDTLGDFPLLLSLSDGDTAVTDTFHLHVENFIPEITSIMDVPDDQGGRVYVSFNASFFDNGEETGQSYSFYRYDNLESDSSGWVLLGSGDAIGDESYTYEATTVMDSTSEGDGMTEYKVVASMHAGIYHSEPMMGYSLDNIAPGVPGGLMAVLVDEGIQLTWEMSADEDFQYYMLEKASDEAFTDPEVFEMIDIAYLDLDYVLNESNYYRLAAVDHAGNMSDYTDVVDFAVLATDDQLTPEVFALHQNYPNPFNPTTQIKYDLPEDALVAINIYDLMGRSIKSLVNSNQSAGYRSIQWNATNNLGEPVSAGMYIYMIQAGEFRQTKKMVLLK